LGEQLQFEDEEISITLRRAWDRALRTLSVRVTRPAFETHIRALRPLSLSEVSDKSKSVYQITLGAPSAFAREWVEKRHGVLISQVLEEILDRDVRLTFGLSPRETAQNSVSAPSLFEEDFTEVAFGVNDAPGDRLNNASTLPTVSASSPSSSPLGNTVTGRPVAPPTTPTRPAQASTAVRTGSRSSGSSGADAPLLNPRYTFANFVVGNTNRLAHAGAKAVSEAPGQTYNPLFLYGSPGLGKTHLMHAIGNEIAHARGADASRVAYISGESFTSNFITSLREHKSEEFRRKWRNVDVWLVDDIQFIAGREHTKEEFFHTFNALYQTGKQIVISSDRSPRELRAMDERLRSRFECGLIADIAPPDLETRLAILHKKADVEKARIPDDVLLYMAKLVQSNIRTLEGALVKIIACASLQNSPVTTQLASDVLERYYIVSGAERSVERSSAGDSEEEAENGSGEQIIRKFDFSGRVTPEMIQRSVARHFNIAPEELMGKKRDRDVVNARQIAMHLVRELTEVTLQGIGKLFEKDHSTVVHACDRVKAQIPKDDSLKRLVEDLITQIQAQAAG
jgi:chromosomal replication initiator protein